MTVLIAAAGDDGRQARALLADAGFDVEHVTTLSAASVRATTVDVLVVGALEDATVGELHGAVPESTPVVALDADGPFETTADRPLDGPSLAAAVRTARQAGAYRRAVDDLYEQCRARATTGDTPDESVTVAKRRAKQAFRDTQDLGAGTPYEHLFAAAADGPTADDADSEASGDSEQADADGSDADDQT